MSQPEWIAGVDEAGRGPLAGPVVAAAVILDSQRPIEGLRDSKQLTDKRREALYTQIVAQAAAWSVGYAEVAEIDEINILQATLLAMRRAVDGLSIKPMRVLVDGNQAPKLACPVTTVIQGDATVEVISAASIIAKVTRDRLMLALAEQYPHYGFADHKGYGTAQHLAALKAHGVTPIHRRSFAPVRELLLVTD